MGGFSFLEPLILNILFLKFRKSKIKNIFWKFSIKKTTDPPK
jgi:hypothetical protein